MDPSSRPSLIERLTALLLREPKDREQLVALLHGAFEHHLMDADALSIIEGALSVADRAVRDIMVPRAQMDVVDIKDAPEQIIDVVLEAAHSRFPAIGESKDDVLGILLAKDLLRYCAGKEFDLRDTLRPAIFVPESKRLNVLLREFRASRNHMAIVVDEYGGVAGLVTIEDEYDFDETEDNIVRDNTGRYRVKAVTEIADFNAAFDTGFPDKHFDTVGGLVIHHLGRLPKRNEVLTIEGLRMQVLRADSRRVHTLLVDPQKDLPLSTPAAGDE